MDAINQFESQKDTDFKAAIQGLSQCVSSIRDLLRSQTKPENFTQGLFEWFFNSIQLKESSPDLFKYILQFSADLILVYLHAVYESNSKLKSMCEAPLMALLMENEKSKHLVQVPALSKPSIYHKATVQLTQSGLTEANLLRHNQTEYTPSKATFSGKTITVNNRLLFLSAVVNLFADNLVTFCHESKVAFCEVCIIIGTQGMGTFFTSRIPRSAPSDTVNIDELSTKRRYSVSDSLVSSLLRGLRVCLFKSCHHTARNALVVLRLRAEYELLTTAIQVSHALTRLTENVQPMELRLDVDKQSCYHGECAAKFENDPSAVHTVLNNHILHCELDSTTSSQATTVEQSVVSLLKVSKSTDV